LEASIHDVRGLGGGYATYVAVVRFVQEIEEHGKAVAVLEAHSTAMTDLERPFDLLCESFTVPVFLLFRIVAETFSGLV
jgi:hypothetical protein